MKRIAIAGGPRTGKTTLAAKLDEGGNGKHVYHTDSVKDEDWSQASLIASRWFDEVDGPLIVEGVRVPHALRKWLEKHKDDGQKPVDVLYILEEPKAEQTPKQEQMGKGAKTVVVGILDELRARGVIVRYGLPEVK